MLASALFSTSTSRETTPESEFDEDNEAEDDADSDDEDEEDLFAEDDDGATENGKGKQSKHSPRHSYVASSSSSSVPQRLKVEELREHYDKFFQEYWQQDLPNDEAEVYILLDLAISLLEYHNALRGRQDPSVFPM